MSRPWSKTQTRTIQKQYRLKKRNLRALGLLLSFIPDHMSKFLKRVQSMLRRPRVPDFSLHLKNAWSNWKRRPLRTFDMLTIVSVKPAVVLAGCHPNKLAKHLQPMLKDRKLTIFYRAGWSMEHSPTFANRVSAIKAAEAQFPLHQYIFAANTLHEVELVRATGVRAEFLNENAFIDEFAFQPKDNQAKEFDAVIDAQIAPYKRLELASRIRTLVVITFTMKERFNVAYGNMVRERLAHANWANGPFRTSTYRKLNRAQVAETYRRARVGLCLSPMEGANLASIQYLLSGLPVVSTESIGGRDVFFDDTCARVVAASPEAVAAAVDDLVRQDTSPTEIRQRTLDKIRPIRGHFANLLTKELGHAPIDEAWWREFNTKRPISFQDLRKIGANLLQSAA